MEHLKKNRCVVSRPFSSWSRDCIMRWHEHTSLNKAREKEVLFEMDIGVLKLALAWSQLLNSTLSSDFRKTSHKHHQDFFSDVWEAIAGRIRIF